MILAPVLILMGLAPPQAKPQVSWVKLEDGVKGSWSAKAVYPILNSDTALGKYFNAEIKRACESRFYETASELKRSPKRPPTEFAVRGILSVAGDRLASALVTVTKSGIPTELVPVTCWLNGKQPLRCVWGSLVRPESDADTFASTLVLPALNAIRKTNGLPPLADFPAGLLDSFVVTQKNMCWIAPPGLASNDASQIKVAIDQVQSWFSANSPIMVTAQVAQTSIPLKGVVTWPAREPVPPGCVLQISLLRDRGATGQAALAVKTFPLKDQPMEISADFVGVKVDPDDRLFVDVRILSGGQTLYRNRAAIRIPGRGWQTSHAIALDRER